MYIFFLRKNQNYSSISLKVFSLLLAISGPPSVQQTFIYTGAVVRWCSVKKVSLEILQKSQENTCAKVSFLTELQAFIKKRLWHRCFPVNFAQFLRTPFTIKHLWWLLLFRIKMNFKLGALAGGDNTDQNESRYPILGP